MSLKSIKITNFQFIVLFFFLLLWLYARVGQYDIHSFMQTHHLFNYEHEFLKRALVGEILRLSFENLDADIIFNLSLLFLIFLSIVFFKIFFINFNKDNNINKLIFSIMVFVSPLTLQHFIFDIGRFEIINILLTLLIFLIIKKFHKNTFLTVIFIFPLLNCMLLIHEGSLFMFIPMIFGFWFFKNSEIKTFIVQLFLFLIIIFITYKISTLGLSTKYTFKEYYNLLLNQHLLFNEVSDHNSFLRINLAAVEVLYRDLFNTYDPNVKYAIFEDTIRLGFRFKSLVDNLILIFLLSPTFFIVFTIYRGFFKVSNFKVKLILITPLAPFALFVLGYDHMRWWAIMFTNIFLILFRLCEEKNLYLEIILTNIQKYKILYIFSIFSSFILGPVKVMHTFDIIEGLNIYQELVYENIN